MSLSGTLARNGRKVTITIHPDAQVTRLSSAGASGSYSYVRSSTAGGTSIQITGSSGKPSPMPSCRRRCRGSSVGPTLSGLSWMLCVACVGCCYAAAAQSQDLTQDSKFVTTLRIEAPTSW